MMLVNAKRLDYKSVIEIPKNIAVKVIVDIDSDTIKVSSKISMAISIFKVSSRHLFLRGVGENPDGNERVPPRNLSGESICFVTNYCNFTNKFAKIVYLNVHKLIFNIR